MNPSTQCFLFSLVENIEQPCSLTGMVGMHLIRGVLIMNRIYLLVYFSERYLLLNNSHSSCFFHALSIKGFHFHCLSCLASVCIFSFALSVSCLLQVLHTPFRGFSTQLHPSCIMLVCIVKTPH